MGVPRKITKRAELSTLFYVAVKDLAAAGARRKSNAPNQCPNALQIAK
jgi:hypothetical protein